MLKNVKKLFVVCTAALSIGCFCGNVWAAPPGKITQRKLLKGYFEEFDVFCKRMQFKADMEVLEAKVLGKYENINAIKTDIEYIDKNNVCNGRQAVCYSAYLLNKHNLKAGTVYIKNMETEKLYAFNTFIYKGALYATNPIDFLLKDYRTAVIELNKFLEHLSQNKYYTVFMTTGNYNYKETKRNLNITNLLGKKDIQLETIYNELNQSGFSKGK